MRRIDFVTLKLFVAIADERSLTRAAEREHLALAAVSKRVSDLESQLGIALLYRQPKGVELTPAGHALLHHARNMMDNLEQLNAEMRLAIEGPGGVQASFDFQGARNEIAGRMLTVTLVNDLDGSDYV